LKLIINTASTFKGGSVQVAASFIRESRDFSGNVYHVILSKAVSELIQTGDFPENFSFYKIPYRPATRVLTFTDQAVFFKQLEKEIKPDVIFTTSGPAYWRPESPHLMGFNLAHYLYPESLYFRIIPIRDRLKWKLKTRFIKYYTKHDADVYVTQTDDINSRLRKWIGKEKIFTVTNTYGSQYDLPGNYANDLLPPRKPGEKRFLILSAYYRHKNLEIINEVIKRWSGAEKDAWRFVVTLPDPVFQRIFSDDVKASIVNVGPVPPDHCPDLYRACDFAFVPTLLECFTAAYPEAMKMGKPIVTTDLDFARTTCGDAALYYRPGDPLEAVGKLRELVKNETLQEALIQKGSDRLEHFLTAKERASRYLEICKEMVEK
jgi:glycosyltransferase involved in cell wall biosynthesis